MAGGPALMAAAALAGYAIGSLPTADILARAFGVDLRSGGTGNPGTNNALRLGGKRLAVPVLLVEFAKGSLAVWLGRSWAGDGGAALAALAATMGNVYNPWFRFRGGKGLAITGGVVAAAWPTLLPMLIGVIGLTVMAVHRSGPAALAALGTYAAAGMLGLAVSLPTGWGLTEPGWLVALALGAAAIMGPKHWADTRPR